MVCRLGARRLAVAVRLGGVVLFRIGGLVRTDRIVLLSQVGYDRQPGLRRPLTLGLFSALSLRLPGLFPLGPLRALAFGPFTQYARTLGLLALGPLPLGPRNAFPFSPRGPLEFGLGGSFPFGLRRLLAFGLRRLLAFGLAACSRRRGPFALGLFAGGSFPFGLGSLFPLVSCRSLAFGLFACRSLAFGQGGTLPFGLRRLLALNLRRLLPFGLRRAFSLDLSDPRGQFGFPSTFALGLLGLFRLGGALTLGLGGTLPLRGPAIPPRGMVPPCWAHGLISPGGFSSAVCLRGAVRRRGRRAGFGRTRDGPGRRQTRHFIGIELRVLFRPAPAERAWQLRQPHPVGLLRLAPGSGRPPV